MIWDEHPSCPVGIILSILTVITYFVEYEVIIDGCPIQPARYCTKCCIVFSLVSGHNATDQTPMYEIPMTFLFWGWGFGAGESIFCIGVLGAGILSLAFCPKIFFTRCWYRYFALLICCHILTDEILMMAWYIIWYLYDFMLENDEDYDVCYMPATLYVYEVGIPTLTTAAILYHI